MRLREQVIDSIGKMPVEKVLMVNQFINRLDGGLRITKRPNPRAYLKVRKALSGCKGSISADILAERNETL